MPHALTERQKEYLNYLNDYIKENEDSPSLKEIANHFGVKSSTSHNILEALQNKDYIYFMRHPDRYFIRLIERGGMGEKILPLFIMGKIDRYGEVIDLLPLADAPMISIFNLDADNDIPEHITIIQKCANPHTIFGLKATERIPQANIEAGDILVVDGEKKPQGGFMSILPVGPDSRLFLCCAYGKTFDDRFFSFDMREPYPLPEKFVNRELGQRLFWHPIAWDEETDEYFSNLGEGRGFPDAPIPMDFVVATVLELIREY